MERLKTIPGTNKERPAPVEAVGRVLTRNALLDEIRILEGTKFGIGEAIEYAEPSTERADETGKKEWKGKWVVMKHRVSEDGGKDTIMTTISKLGSGGGELVEVPLERLQKLNSGIDIVLN